MHHCSISFQSYQPTTFQNFPGLSRYENLTVRKRNPTSKLMLDRTASIWERYITCTEEFHSSIRWLPKSGWCHAEKSIFCKIERKPVQEEIATTKLWFRAPQSASTGIASCLRWKQMPPSNSHIQNHGKTLLHSLLS